MSFLEIWDKHRDELKDELEFKKLENLDEIEKITKCGVITGCPVCANPLCHYDYMNIFEGEYARQKASCHKCGLKWAEYYKWDGIQILSTKGEKT